MKNLKEFKKVLGKVAKAVTNKAKIKWSVGKKCEYPYDCLVIYNDDLEINVFWDDDEQEWGVDVNTEIKVLKSIRVKESKIENTVLRLLKSYSLI